MIVTTLGATVKRAAKRFLSSLPALFGVLVFTFLLMRVLLLLTEIRWQPLAVAQSVIREASRLNITLVFIVFRSWRTLAAIMLTLGASVAVAVGVGDIFGYSNSVVSTLVPLTVMVTTTATLVYLHSRFMEPDQAVSLLDHHARALANKFLPCTASMFATAVGFAALAVSEIRPVREMGLWTACGLVTAWLACFTLFPALQSLLRTPQRSHSAIEGKWFAGTVALLVPATLRYRWYFVLAALAIIWAVRREAHALPFVLALVLVFLGYSGFAISLWPNIIPPSVSIWDAAGPPQSLGFTLVGALFTIPFILFYTAWAYHVFRGKVKAGERYH